MNLPGNMGLGVYDIMVLNIFSSISVADTHCFSKNRFRLRQNFLEDLFLQLVVSNREKTQNGI